MAVALVARHVPDGGHGGHQGDESEPVRTDTGSRKERTLSRHRAGDEHVRLRVLRTSVSRRENHAAGDQSMLDIADSLNAAGFRPRSKRERLVFSKATVRGMLENPVYVGDITHHGDVIGRGRHEPIISRKLWEKVQQVRNERARRPQVYGARPRRPYLLSGVAVCSACGLPSLRYQLSTRSISLQTFDKRHGTIY